ncbi:FAD/NAD(P)-binding protein [Aliiroseovarius crassostreae]|uniref:FAD/NAD(P)-binding protein n=1 Tax=Aliiroseovarius crassostreae TaxID=154981 RepID=UPI003C7BC261
MLGYDQPTGAYELLFAGGGFSASMTLIHVLQELAGRRTAADGPELPPIRIAVFDDRGRFPKGLSYSEDETSSAFLITPASEMMPPVAEGGNVLTRWLAQNRPLWENRLQHSQNAIVQAWLPRLIDAVERRDFERAFLPRSVIGWFLEDQVGLAMQDAEAKGYARVDILPKGVRRVGRRSGEKGLFVTVEDGATYKTDQLVVAVGSGTFGALPAGIPVGRALMTKPLENGVSALRRDLEERLQDYDGALGPKVLIIGSNASSLDVVSVLLDLHRQQGKTARITSMSPSGQFPPEYRDSQDARDDPCAALAERGASPKSPTARDIYDCALQDLCQMQERGVHIGEAKTLIYRHVLALIGRLSPEEKCDFVEVYGNDLSRRFYMTSPIYAELYRNALDDGQVKTMSGCVVDIQPSEGGAGVTYEAAGKTELETFDLVVDCSGFEHPLEQSSNPLIQSLFADLGARQNRSGRGFKTASGSFLIAPDVSVLGPLYAGNVDRTGVCRWHLETTRGISEIAKLCAQDLVPRLARTV